LKTPEYWADLKKDIREAGAILTPLHALPDGTILAGHSRWKIAGELRTEGLDLRRLPVLIVASPITPEEAERRVYLDNLTRFEIDEDTRLVLWAKVWPGYYLMRGDTVSPPISKAEIARATGQSERQVQRDAALVRSATALAKTEGKSAPEAIHLRKAREEANTKRREKEGDFLTLAKKTTLKMPALATSLTEAITTVKGMKGLTVSGAIVEVVAHLEYCGHISPIELSNLIRMIEPESK